MVEGELEYKCQSDYRSKCYSDKKYLSKESEKEIRKEEKKKEKRRDKQSLVVLKSIWDTGSKKSLCSILVMLLSE